MKTAGFTDRKSAHIPDGIWDMGYETRDCFLFLAHLRVWSECEASPFAPFFVGKFGTAILRVAGEDFLDLLDGGWAEFSFHELGSFNRRLDLSEGFFGSR